MQQRVEHGWSYERQTYRNKISFTWGDEGQTVFGGTCDSQPRFLLMGGDYPDDPGAVDVEIDGSTTSVTAAATHHGRVVMMDDEATVRRMANAKGPIIFRANGWKRELSPNPLIKRFVEECEAMRKVDPDADGLPGYTLR